MKWKKQLTKTSHFELVFIILVAMVVIIAGYLVYKAKHSKSSFTLASPAFSSRVIDSRYTCDGDDLSPALEIHNPPAGTKDYAVIMQEDAGLHKVANPEINFITWNIPVSTTKILQGIRPAGTIARNSKGNFAYNGPCPDPGKTKKYIFTFYALDTVLTDINSSGSVADLQSAMKGHVVGKVVLYTSYTRSTSAKTK